MTLEELQAKVKELTEAQEALIEANNGLRADLKKAKNELSKGQQIDPNDFIALQNENDSLKTKMSETEKLYKETLKTTEKIQKQYEQESKFTHGLLVDNGLNDVLVKSGVSNPAMLKAVKSMLASQVKIEAEGETRVAKIGDKPLADYVSEWAKSEEGKYFVSAPVNNGGGSAGGAADTVKQNLTSTQKIAQGLAKL